MRYVVTGATGCLGLNLTKRLIRENHEVIALGRNPRLGELITQWGAQFISLDLSEKTKLKQITTKADVIFHCAALSSPWGAYREFYQANVLGTQHVIEATPKQSRLVHVSSPSIYFDFTEKHQIKENAKLPKTPANHYVKTKLLAEALIDKAYQEQNLDVVTIRPRAIFGPYDRAILTRLLAAERNGFIPVIGTGEQVIDITYVDNVVESLILAANASTEVKGKKFNITNDESMPLMSILTLLFNSLKRPIKVKKTPYSIAKIAARILENVHRLPFLGEPQLTQYSCAVLALGQTLNIDEAKQMLGYKPIVSIEEGLNRFADWYQTR